MKAWLPLCLATALIASGCGLLPKKVEYFQDKVHAMPEASEKNKEYQKETAAMAKERARETLMAASQENASTNVIAPAIDAAVLTDSLSGSLGKPVTPWTGPAGTLAKKLDKEDAKLDTKVEDFRAENNENAGKKIEGTGAIQIPYFLNLLLLAVVGGIIFLAFQVVKVLAAGTPFGGAVSVGTKVVEGGSKAVGSLISRGFSELIEGGEQFKKWVDEEFEDPDTKKKIKELFRSAHIEKQSRDTQDVVKKLTS